MIMRRQTVHMLLTSLSATLLLTAMAVGCAPRDTQTPDLSDDYTRCVLALDGANVDQDVCIYLGGPVADREPTLSGGGTDPLVITLGTGQTVELVPDGDIIVTNVPGGRGWILRHVQPGWDVTQ
jgi:hypothetical protein